MGLSARQIGRAFEIDSKTVTKYFAEELAAGALQAQTESLIDTLDKIENSAGTLPQRCQCSAAPAAAPRAALHALSLDTIDEN